MSPPESPGRARPHRRTMIAAALLIGLLGTGAGILSALYFLNRPTGVSTRQVQIEKGMSVLEIGRALRAEGVIRSPRLLAFLSLVNGSSRKLTAGVHPFGGRMSTWDVLQELTVPRDITRDVTIPEGLRLGQTVAMLTDSLGLDGDRLLQLATSEDYCASVGVSAGTLEGYLFPETYRFSLSMTEPQVLRLMVDHFFRIVDVHMRERARKMGMTVHDLVTLASIVEGEARVDAERPVIAAVYHNRLRKQMRLQADPTVQYALEDGPRRLFYRDYEIDSPYNTYRFHGLPPGPIMSPGEASLQAVLSPAVVDFLYFVAQGDGTHLFSRTAAEHEDAKRKTYRVRREGWR